MHKTNTRTRTLKSHAHCIWLDREMAYAHTKIVVFVTFVGIAVLTNFVEAKLSSTAADVSNGACNFPTISQLDLNLRTNALDLYSPLRPYFIPRASQAFYRAEYEMLNGGQSADTENQIAALQPRARFLTLNALRSAGVLEVSFHEGREDWFAYRCLPSSFGVRPLSAALLNVTCTLVGGRVGVATKDQAGAIYYSVIWSDATAANIWGCIHGEKNFHILSTKTELTPGQVVANEVVLKKLGFDPAKAMDMHYTNTL